MKKVRVIKPSRKVSIRGKAASKKMNAMIPWESTLESDFIKILEFDPNVMLYDSQTTMIEYIFNGKELRYFPDFKVITKESEVIIFEVKAKSKLDIFENQIKFQVGKMYCEGLGWSYRIVTEDDIRPGYLIENLILLSEVREHTTSNEVMILLWNKLNNTDWITIKELRTQCLNVSEELFQTNLYYMIYTLKIQFNLVGYLVNDYKSLIKQGVWPSGKYI